QSIKFDLSSGGARCFSEDVKKYAIIFGKYSIVSPNEGHPVHENHTITVRVTTQGGSSSHHLADHVQAGQFAFVSHDSGDYLVCFWADASNNPQATLSIDFEWKTGVAGKDSFNIAKRSKIEVSDHFECVVYMCPEVTSSRSQSLTLGDRLAVSLAEIGPDWGSSVSRT
ncbi:transmembrane emp24 domain-containing protein p24delta9-like, partial [Trifolium pratense]